MSPAAIFLVYCLVEKPSLKGFRLESICDSVFRAEKDCHCADSDMMKPSVTNQMFTDKPRLPWHFARWRLMTRLLDLPHMLCQLKIKVRKMHGRNIHA